MDFEVTYLEVDEYGIVDPQVLKNSIRDDTILVSVQHANQEIGSIQDIKAIGEICKEKGVIFHTDATHTFTKVPLDVSVLPVDLVTISAHTIHGPNGIGALDIKKNKHPWLDGGFQEFNKRGGLRSSGSCKLDFFERGGRPVTGIIEMKIFAEFVGTDGVLARREVFVVRRNVDQPHLKDFGLTLEEGKVILQRVQAEQTQFQVEQCGMRDRECTGCERRRAIHDYRKRSIHTLFGIVAADALVAARRATRASSESRCVRWSVEIGRIPSCGLTPSFFPLPSSTRRGF